MPGASTTTQTEVSIDRILTRDRETDEEVMRWRARVENSERDFSTYADTPHETLRILADAVENNSNGLEDTPLYQDGTDE